MGLAESRQASFDFDPIEPRQLPRWGFWTLNRVPPGGGRMTQEIRRLDQMEWILRHLANDRDTYMSQGFFARPCRRAVHLLACTHAQVDLDVYNMPQLRGLTADQLGGLVRIFCRDEGIEPPSAVVFSGRGLYLKWYWTSPIPRAAAGRAVAVNRALVARFAEFGADPAAVDMSRILRVIGTVNSKSGETVRLLHQEIRDGAPVTYDFELFADEVLPHTMEAIRGFRDAAKARQAEVRILQHEKARRRAAQTQGNRRVFSREDWHWGVLEDIRTLAEIRFGGRVRYSDDQAPAAGGGKRPGADLFAHLGACQLAMVMPDHVLWREIQAWGRIILPTDYAGSEEFARHSSTLLDRARKAAAGETVEQGGRKLSPVWTYSKERLIELLQVDPAEMPRMTRLIDKGEKQRRDTVATREKRRADGVLERAAYIEQQAEQGAARAARAKTLRAGGLSWDEVARRMELGSAEAARSLAKRAR